MSDTLPPTTSEAKRQEEIVLGSLLRWPAGIDDVSLLLQPEDFSWYHHGLIYRVVIDLRERGVPVTLETVADELNRRRQIKELGGYAARWATCGRHRPAAATCCTSRRSFGTAPECGA